MLNMLSSDVIGDSAPYGVSYVGAIGASEDAFQFSVAAEPATAIITANRTPSPRPTTFHGEQDSKSTFILGSFAYFDRNAPNPSEPVTDDADNDPLTFTSP
jgi:hypothetical protein